MTEKKKAIMSWSGGKDSAHALLRALQSETYEIVAFLTTTNRDTALSTMHNIPLELLHAQSESIGIPLHIVPLKPAGNMDDYTAAMTEAAKDFKQRGVTHFIFGDILLEDIRKYREQLLRPLGLEAVEPLWGSTSEEVMEAYLDSSLKTVIVTTGKDGLGISAIGKIIDREFIAQLPEGMDVNGENGEYHTFCFDGPIFRFPIPFDLGTPTERSYDIRLDDGSVRTFTYCFAQLQALKKD